VSHRLLRQPPSSGAAGRKALHWLQAVAHPHCRLDLSQYRPRGDKRNTPFFEEHLLRVYERRASSGLDQLVGPMAALVVQVDHGHLFD